jgi:3-dehydroquinate dehydratase-2
MTVIEGRKESAMVQKKKILILNGPNLNLLGTRQPEIYGKLTLAQIEKQVRTLAKELAVEVDFRQSNSEGELVTWIQQAAGTFGAIVINRGLYPRPYMRAISAVSLRWSRFTLSSILARAVPSSFPVPKLP